MPVWVSFKKEHSWSLRAPYLDEWGSPTRTNGIEGAILRGDIKETWNLITGFINKYILTEEEYLQFK